MPRDLEEKMHNLWTSELKSKEFKNPKIQLTFKNLNMWRLLSHILMEKYSKEQIGEAYGSKHRLVFKNQFDYFLKSSGEYLLLTSDLLQIFSRRRLPVFVKNLPIFVQVKSTPCFWINGGMITLWNFYFPEEKIRTTFEEVMRFSNKIAVFPRIEFSSWNFIQTYSSVPDNIFLFSTLKKENEELFDILEKYITKDFWIIPNKNIKEVNPFCITLFSEGSLLPCVPHRVVFKVLQKRKVKFVRFFGKETKYLQFLISYINASKEIKTDVMYFPIKLFNTRLEEGKVYNGLIFSFIDFNNEWIYPILFSFYEEDLHSYEIFQELSLIIFKNKYFKSGKIFSIEIDREELLSELKDFARYLWKRKLLEFEDAFSRLDEKNIVHLLFSGLYPLLIESDNRIFYTPLPISLLNIDKNKMIEFVKNCDKYASESDNTKTTEERNKLFLEWSFYISDTLNRNMTLAGDLIRNIKQKALFIEYLKEMVSKLEVIEV